MSTASNTIHLVSGFAGYDEEKTLIVDGFSLRDGPYLPVKMEAHCQAFIAAAPNESEYVFFGANSYKNPISGGT